MVLRAARPVDDPVARRRRSRAKVTATGGAYLHQNDRRRHDDAPGLPRRRAGACLRVVAAPVQGTEAGRGRRPRHGGVRRRPALEREAAALPAPHRLARDPAGAEARRGDADRSSKRRAARLECRHFLDCVATGARPRTDGREGLRVLRVLARASAALKGAGRPSRAAPAKPAAFPGVQIHASAFVDEPLRDRRRHPHLALRAHPAAHPDRSRLLVRPERHGRTRRDGRRRLQDPEQRVALQGRDAGGRRVLRAVLRLHQRQQPAGRSRAQGRIPPYSGQARRDDRRQRDDRLRAYARRVRVHRRRRGGDAGCAGLRADGRGAGAADRLDEPCRREAWPRPRLSRVPAGAIARPGPDRIEEIV